MTATEKYNRHSIRLKDYDYSQAGAYFITICVEQHQCLLGEIKNECSILSDLGQLTEQAWLLLPEHFDRISLDCYIVMPNHFHGIIFINDRS
jgi:putative transposase